MKHQSLLTKISIKADASGNVPNEIELLRAGDWHTLYHGDFEITLADLYEYAANFAKGVGLVEGDRKAPINYAHESWDKAAGWITALSVSEERQALVGSVEWTTEAEAAIKDKQWSYISPEFNPRDSYPYLDPEGTDEKDGVPQFIANVLTGAALTNIPLFKKLKPIMASRVPSKSKKADVTSGDGKNHNQGEPMKLEDILAKQVSERSDEEKAFLSEHAADLTDEQKAQVETEASDAEAQAKADKEAADKAAADKAEADAKAAEEAARVEASRKGQVSISASELATLKADAQAGREAKAELERSKAEGIVASAVKDGRVKSDDKDGWVNQLLASRGDSRTQLESLLASLPANEEIGKELGDGGKDVSTDATEELHAKVVASIKASADKGATLPYSQARREVLAADAELAKRVKEEDN